MVAQQLQHDGHYEEAALVARALRGESNAIRLIMQRHNRRLYRIARSVVRDDGEAEDVVQDAYLRAFTRLHEFRGQSRIGNWLSRIVLNESIGRLRRRRQVVAWEAVENQHCLRDAALMTAQPDPEHAVAQRQIQLALERAIDRLPARFRTVLIMRLVEGMSVEETAEILAIRSETVKTRLHRARYILRKDLEGALGPSLVDTFPFEGERCQRITEKVLTRWSALLPSGWQRPFSVCWNPRAVFTAFGLRRWMRRRAVGEPQTAKAVDERAV